MNIDKDWERESKKVRDSLPMGVKGRIRVLNRRVELKPGESWFEMFIAASDDQGCEISYDLDIKTGDVVEIDLAGADKTKQQVVQGKVEWVRKNSMPILGQYTCRINTAPEKDKRGRIG